MNININAYKINDLTDARFFAAANANYIAFDFYTEQALDIETAKEIKDWIQGPDYILMFDKFDPDTIFECSSKLECTNIFLPFESISNSNSDYNFFTSINNIKQIDTLKDRIPEKNITVEIFNRPDFEAFFAIIPSASYKLNLSLEMQKKLILEYQIKSICIYGENEAQVGVKNYDEINDFLEWAEEINEETI